MLGLGALLGLKGSATSSSSSGRTKGLGCEARAASCRGRDWAGGWDGWQVHLGGHWLWRRGAGRRLAGAPRAKGRARGGRAHLREALLV
jgi:hypothetical protein